MDEHDEMGVNGRDWGERAGQWLGLLGEVSERMEGYEERVGAQRMSGRRREWQERMEEQREWERQEEERQRQSREELVEEERRACEDEMSSQPRMRAWLRRDEGEWEWEGMVRREREESVARGELEREERKRRVAGYERRHQERIRQVPDWQRRSWEKMERWLEMSKGEEGREEVKELRVVRRVLELELAEAEAAGRCVESVSEGVAVWVGQCGVGEEDEGQEVQEGQE